MKGQAELAADWSAGRAESAADREHLGFDAADQEAQERREAAPLAADPQICVLHCGTVGEIIQSPARTL